MKSVVVITGGFLISVMAGCAPSPMKHSIVSVARVGLKDAPVQVVQFLNDESPRTTATDAFFSNFCDFLARRWAERCEEDARPACAWHDNQVAVIQDDSLAAVMVSVHNGPEKFREVSDADITTETPVLAAKRLAGEVVRALVSQE